MGGNIVPRSRQSQGVASVMVSTMNKTIPLLALLSVAAIGSAQNLFNVSVTPTETAVDNLNVLFSFEQDNATIGFAVPLLQSAAPGTTTTIDFGTNVPLSSLRYGVLGTHGADGVTIGVSTSVANALVGQTWESVFTNPLFNKAAVRSALETNNVGLTLLFADYVSTLQVNVGGQSQGLLAAIGTPTALLNFSTASLNGSANLQTVPEPATMAALGMGAAAVLRRRRRKSA